MKRVSIILLVFLLLLSIVSANEIKTYTEQEALSNPSPTITITYEESDAPIVIREAKLYRDYSGVRNPVQDQNGQEIFSYTGRMIHTPTSPGLGAFDQYEFQVNEFLPTGFYVLVIIGDRYDDRSETNLGKEHHLEVFFEIDAETMNIWVSQPRIPFLLGGAEDIILDLQTQYGVGNSDDFFLELQTQFATQCSIQKVPVVGLELEAYYETGDKFNFNNENPSTSHRIRVADQSYAEYQGDDTVLSVVGPFNYQDYETQSNYLVVCRQEQVGGNYLYHQRILYVGYDTTPPNITAEFVPHLVVDPNDMTTLLNVSSKGDLMACTYRFSEQAEFSRSGKILATSSLPLSDEFGNIEDYSSVIQREFPMGNVVHNYPIGEDHNFAAEIICQNLAGLEDRTNANFIINLDEDLVFSVVNENGFTLYGDYHNYTSASPEIHIRTNLLSTCEYVYDEETTIITSEPTRDHIFTFDKEENDIYGAEILMRCQIPFSDTYYQETIVIAKDTNSPKTPELNELFAGTDFTCDGSIMIEIQDPQNDFTTLPYGDGGDVVAYEFSLYDGNELLSTGQTNFFQGASLVLDEEALDTLLSFTSNDFDKDYTWEVIAIDGVGQQSSPARFTIQRLDWNNPRCDTQAPTGSHEALLGPTGYEVSFSCDDSPEGNCASSLLYAQLPLGSSCQDAELQSLPLENSLNFNEDSVLCYQFFDVAQPENFFSPLYQVDITPEVNIEFLSPKSGIGTQPSFDFVFSTPSRNDRSLSCKHGPASLQAQNLFSQRNYQAIYELSFLEEITTSNGREHTINFNAAANSVIGTQYDETQESDIQDWLIVCKETGIDVYPTRFFELGFDTTAPVITANVLPDVVENPLDLRATLEVDTNEESFCEYSDIVNAPGFYSSLGTGIFESYTTYQTSFIEFINYTEADVLDVTQELRCYNKAGLSSTSQVSYRVEAKGDLDITFDLDEFYETQFLTLEARTPGQWSNCEISIDGDDFIGFNQRTGDQSLDYIHEHRVTLEDGAHRLRTKCTAWFNDEVGFVTQDITIDTTDPTIDIQVKSPSCSLDTITATIATDGTGSALITQNYILYDQEGDEITQGELTDFIFELRNLNLNLGENVLLEVYVEDQVGRNATQDATILVATQENVACDITPPESNLAIVDVYRGVELTVSCSDGETSCTDSFYYYFDDMGACLFDDPEEVQVSRYTNQPLQANQSTTFCYYVVDEGLNPSLSQSQEIDIIASCSNGLFDTTETGVDCGGNCPLQDCGICRNEIYDSAWEESVDCGGVCSALCSNGGSIPFSIELLSPFSGVSDTRDFTFEIETNRQATCRYGKYNPDLGLSYRELYEQMRSLDYPQEFSSNFNGEEHTVGVDGDLFAGSSGLDTYLEEAIIICREFDEYIPLTLDYFGFDTTAPNLSIDVTPNPVTDPSFLATQLYVVTDDLTICKYTNRETQTQDFFFGEEYFDRDSYRVERSTTLDYWAEDAFDDIQEISCTNLAGTTTQQMVTIEVRPEYSQDIQILNNGEIYSETSGRVLLEVETNLYATCRYRLNDIDDFIEMDMVDPFFGLQGTIALATQHERQIFVEEGENTVEVQCNLLYDFFGSQDHAIATFTQDSELPQVELALNDATCSLDSLQAIVGASDATTDIVALTYDVEVGAELLREQVPLSQPWNQLSTFIDLSPYQGSQLALTLYATDEAGNTRQVRRSTQVTDATDPRCDFNAPTGTYDLSPVWGGYEFSVTCEDGENNCADDYLYTFQENGCGDFFAPWPLSTTQFFGEAGTLCAQVYDLGTNLAPVYSESISFEANCFNYQWDPQEEGIDCGGVCSISCSTVESLCENGVQDAYEEGVDCGGVCQDKQSCGGCTGPNCASCENGIADFNEEGIDCGGACSNACPVVVEDSDLSLILPPFEVASTPDFVLEVRTADQATCRHGFLANARPSDVDDWYLTLNDFDLTNSRTHTAQIQSETIPQLDHTAASSSTAWVVICQAGDTYHVRELNSFGFDTTPAALEASITPSLLVDPGNLVSTLELLSDEPVACTYTDNSGIATYFPTSDISFIEGYARDHTIDLEFWGQDDVQETYQIICRNLAQSVSRVNVSLEVDLTDSVGISSHFEDLYNTNRVTLNVSTQQLATCRFRFDQDAAYDEFGISTSYAHERTISLDEGEHTIEVQCVSDSTGDSAILFDEFFIDTQSPELELVLSTSTCGLEDYSFSILSDGTGTDIEGYEYVLEQGGEEVLRREISRDDVTLDYDFEEGTSYRLSVTAYDEAGNTREVIETIRAESYDPLSCDDTDPTGSITIEPRWNGYDVTVDCFDENNCSESFEYVLSDGGVCEESYRVEQYSNLPLAVTQTTTFCYEVFDEAGNSYEGLEDITYELSCFNGVEDPSEEGVDCGGTCLAECGTCTNRVKDIFEEGVDCGGVCESLRSCSDISGLYDEFVDSDDDGLDDSWEEFYFGDLEEDGSGDPDQDGLENIEEYLSVTDPTMSDTDEDGLSDLFEITYFGDLDETPQGDPDNDTLSNLIEFAIDTNPTVYDITDEDQDGLADQWEEFYFDDLNETAEGDFDGDGLTNLEEYIFNTNPKVYTEREECEVDSDCNYGFRCDYTFTCVIDEDLRDDIFEEVQPGVNIVGIILLILGLLFMGGGIAYIIYSRKQFKESSKKISAKEKAKQQKLLAEQHRKQEQKKQEALAKKKAAQEKARAAKLQKRKSARSKVLGSFAQKPKPTTTSKTTTSKPKTKPSKLDDGLSEEFVDIRDLGKGKGKESTPRKKEPIPKNMVKKSQENVFDSLSKITKKKK